MTATTKSSPLEILKEKVKDAKNQLAYRFIALVTTPTSEKHYGFLFVGTNMEAHRFNCDNFSVLFISNPDIHAKQAVKKCRTIQAISADLFSEDGEDFYARHALEDLSEDASRALQNLREPRAYTTEGIFIDSLLHKVYVMNFSGHYTEGSLDDADGKVHDGGEIEALADIYTVEGGGDEAPSGKSDEPEKKDGEDAPEKDEPPVPAVPDYDFGIHVSGPTMEEDAGDGSADESGTDSKDKPVKDIPVATVVENPEPESDGAEEEILSDEELSFRRTELLEVLKGMGYALSEDNGKDKPFGTIFIAGAYNKKFRTQLVEIISRNFFVPDPGAENVESARKDILGVIAGTDNKAAKLQMLICGPIT